MKQKDKEDKYQKINSLKLIHLVRAQEVLYNSDADNYNDKKCKEMAWEHIYKSLFPRYDTLSNNVKEYIGTNVRRRWKTLRNAIAREVKKNATVENYIRKKESPVIAELEFLIPHIKSAHCAKLADELGLRDCYANVNENDEQEYDDDYNDTVDLTDLAEEQQDIKLFALKSNQRANDVPYNATTVVPKEALYPSVQLNTLDDSTSSGTKQSLAAAWRHIDNVVSAAAAAAVNNANAMQAQQPQSISDNTNWPGEYCSVVQCSEGEFMNSTLLCTNPDVDENHDEHQQQPLQQQRQTRSSRQSGLRPGTDPEILQQQQRQTKVPSPNHSAKKRLRHSACDLPNGIENVPTGDLSNGCESGEMQSKIMRLLESFERRENRDHDSQDEDRMFLLSLVSDLKRVPSAKKMLLKAEIAMAIARAIPP